MPITSHFNFISFSYFLLMTLKVVLPRDDQKRRKGNAMEIAEGKEIPRANYSLRSPMDGFSDRGQHQYSHSMR